MSANLNEIPPRRGLRPGQRHEGQFKKGSDERRFPSRRLPDGTTLASLARQYTPECVEVLTSIAFNRLVDLQGKPVVVTPAEQLRATEIILNRGWGKAKETVHHELSTFDGREPTDEELIAIISGTLRPPIDVEAVEVNPGNDKAVFGEDAPVYADEVVFVPSAVTRSSVEDVT